MEVTARSMNFRHLGAQCRSGRKHPSRDGKGRRSRRFPPGSAVASPRFLGTLPGENTVTSRRACCARYHIGSTEKVPKGSSTTKRSFSSAFPQVLAVTMRGRCSSPSTAAVSAALPVHTQRGPHPKRPCSSATFQPVPLRAPPQPGIDSTGEKDSHRHVRKQLPLDRPAIAARNKPLRRRRAFRGSVPTDSAYSTADPAAPFPAPSPGRAPVAIA